MVIDFSKNTDGLVPAIIQHALTRQVLMLGYMNATAFQQTQATKKVTFFSRSKNRLWTKGESSGHYLHVQSIFVDCDADTILILALPDGPTCHRQTTSCFDNEEAKGFIYQLQSIIEQRIQGDHASSYTKSLVERGINKVAQKLGEEAVELVIEAKDNNDELFKNEAADLLYHYLILLKAKNFTLEDIEAVLQARHKK